MTENLVLTDAMRRRFATHHPGRIPIIVNRAPNTCHDIPDLPRKKFLVNGDLTMGQFIYVIRRQLTVRPEQAIFVFVGNTLPTSSQTLREVYGQYADADGALRMTYTSESAFG
jgi:GABA(A) receptor-associated protein